MVAGSIDPFARFFATGDTVEGVTGMSTMCAQMLRADARERGFEPISPDEVEAVELARTSFHHFVEYCFRDENGNPIRQKDFHDEWHEFETQHKQSVLWAPVEHGKTKQRTIYYALWKQGQNPNELQALVSATAKAQAEPMLGEIKSHIEHNVLLHRVFPALRKGRPWGQARASVDRSIVTRDPSFQALGFGGPINGSRLTVIHIDDLLSFKNTYTPALLEKVIAWIKTDVLSRLLEGGEIHFRGTAWKKDDAMHHFAERMGFASRRYRAIKVSLDDLRAAKPGDDVGALWPEKWTVERLQTRLGDPGHGGSLEFSRTMLNETKAEGESYFDDKWIIAALQAGHGIPFAPLYVPNAAERVAIGVDLAHSDKVAAHDLNVLSALSWDGKRFVDRWCETDADGRWTPDQHVRRVDELSKSFSAGSRKPDFAVESNLGQKHFARFAAELSDATIVAAHTGAEKRDPIVGVSGMAVMMERNAWAIPSGCDAPNRVRLVFREAGAVVAEFWVHPEVYQMVTEMQDYREGDRHIPDRLAARWKAFSHLGGVQRGSMRDARWGSGKQRKRRVVSASRW